MFWIKVKTVILTIDINNDLGPIIDSDMPETDTKEYSG